MSKKISQLFGLLFFLAVVLVGVEAQGQDVYNLQDEFSTATNSDTTTWSFRFQNANILDSNNIPDNTIRNGVYALMTGDTNLQGETGQNGWANMNAGILRWDGVDFGDGSSPQIIKNITGADDVYNANLTWPSNAVSMYLDQSTLTVLSWLAPSNGTVNVNYEFVSEWLNQGAQVMWFVDHGDQTGNLASGTIADSDSGLQTNNNVVVTAGDQINFICEPVIGSAWNYAYTRVIARISYTNNASIVYDDEAQFDATTNTDTNIWSYRFQAYNDGTTNAPDFSDRNGIYTLIPDNWTYYNISSTSAGWIRMTDYSSYGAGFPGVVQNQTAAAFAYAGIPWFLIPQNGIYVNPDCDTMAVVSWLAPSNGTVSILYEFNALDWQDRYFGPDLNNDGTLDYIDKGDSNGNLASIRIDPNTNHSTFLVDTGLQGIYNVTVNAGDRINFVVNPTGRREQYASGDTIGISAEIQYYGGGVTPPTPPTLSPPQQTPPGPVYEGGTVSLSVGVQGSLPLYLQWTQNGQPLAGQTSTNLVLSNITIAADAGSYALVAVNPGATVTSSPVMLNLVAGPPVITVQPASQTVFPGSAVSLTVSAVGALPTYQWQFNSNIIAGATNQTLDFPSVDYTNAGFYTVTLSNSFSVSNSQPAQLTVLDPPIMANVTYGLVAHYRFDGDCTDSSGHGHNGTPEGSPSFIAGKIGSGAIQVYDGKSDGIFQYVALGDPTDFQFNAGDSFSISLWVNYTNTPGDLPIIGNSAHSTYNPGWVIADGVEDGYGGEIEFSLDGASFYDFDVPALGGGQVNDGNWHHLVMAIDRSNVVVNVYIDGVLAGTNTALNLGSLNPGYQTAIGCDPTGHYLGNSGPGGYSIDDVGIWRRALSSAEVAGIYAAGNSGNSFDTFGPVQLTTKLTSTGQLEISWQQGTLQSTTNLNEAWTPVSGATAPVYVVTPTNNQTFYSVQ